MGVGRAKGTCRAEGSLARCYVGEGVVRGWIVDTGAGGWIGVELGGWGGHLREASRLEERNLPLEPQVKLVAYQHRGHVHARQGARVA